MKMVLLFLLISFSTVFGQWVNVGNVEKLSGDGSGFFDYAISEDCKFIFTLDWNSVLSKWDYNTGNNIWSKTITNYSNGEPKIDYLRLSSDAKTYCISRIYSNLFAVRKNYHIDIYDIETSNFIDSANILIDIKPGAFYVNPKFSYFYCDFVSTNKTLLSIIHSFVDEWFYYHVIVTEDSVKDSPNVRQ